MRDRWRSSVIVAAVLASAAAGVARGDCQLWTNLQDAQALHDKVAAAASKATLSTALEFKVALLVGPKFIKNPAAGWIEALRTLQPELTAGEWGELIAYFAADAAYEASDASLKAANDAYTQESIRSAEAVKKAEAEYAEEVKFLDAERAAIQNMSTRDDAYLDRASKLAQRLRQAYTKMNASLAPFVDCFPDARRFVADKEKRLKKLDALEAEIARRRGVKPGANPADASASAGTGAAAQQADPLAKPGDAPPPGPPGAVWKLVDVRISKWGGAIKSAGVDGYSIEVPQDDGTVAKSSVKFDHAPPDEMQVNKTYLFQATASGDPRAFITCGMWVDQVRGAALESDNACSNHPSGFKSTGNPTVAMERFYFTPDDRNTEIVAQFHGGKYNGDDVKIQWVYHRK